MLPTIKIFDRVLIIPYLVVMQPRVGLGALRLPAPLRTVREAFTSHGSSIPGEPPRLRTTRLLLYRFWEMVQARQVPSCARRSKYLMYSGSKGVAAACTLQCRRILTVAARNSS